MKNINALLKSTLALALTGAIATSGCGSQSVREIQMKSGAGTTSATTARGAQEGTSESTPASSSIEISSTPGAQAEALPPEEIPNFVDRLLEARALENEREDTLQIDFRTLREKLLSGNMPIMSGINRVHQAKEQLNIARGGMLPSINLGSLLYSAGSPTFILSQIEFLLPFLLPSKWFDLDRADSLFEAEKIAYKVLELNQYASSAAIYATAVADNAVLEALTLEYQDLKRIQEILETMDRRLGIVSEDDLARARAQTAAAALKVAKVMELIIQESASIKHALALPLTTVIGFKEEELPSTPWEIMKPELALTEVIKIAPEFMQLAHLKDAAKADKWSKIFSFINTSTLSATSFPGSDGAYHNASLSRLIGREGVGLGFAYIPTIRLSEGNIKEIEFQTEEMKLQQANVLEVTIKQIEQAKAQIQQAMIAEAGFKKVFDIKEARFKLGTETIFTLLYARTQYTESTIETIRAKSHLNMLRISLDRATLSGYFEDIAGCLAKEPPKKEGGFFLWNWIKNIFVSNDEERAELEKQLDRVCKPS